jgi:hypothetical protein
MAEPEKLGAPDTVSGGLTDSLAKFRKAREEVEARQGAVETATCVFSLPLKKEIQDVADTCNMSVARWIIAAFEWCQQHGITPRQVQDAATWVAVERTKKVDSGAGVGTPNRAPGSGVVIRENVYALVYKVARGVRPRMSPASVLEGCSVIRLASLQVAPAETEKSGTQG